MNFFLIVRRTSNFSHRIYILHLGNGSRECYFNTAKIAAFGMALP